MRPDTKAGARAFAGRIGNSAQKAAPVASFSGVQKSVVHATRDCLMASYETTPDFVVVADADGRMMYMNPSARRMSGISSEEAVQHCDFKDCFSASTYQRILDEAFPVLQLGGTWRGDGAMQVHAGNEIPVSLVMTAFEPRDSHCRYVSCVARDISDHAQREKQLRYQASHDGATGLPNRLEVYDRLNLTLLHAQRYDSTAAVLFLDIDNFKQVNEALGHLDADRILGQAAERLKRCVRTTDTVGRYGGDEFVIVLSKLKDTAEISTVLKKVKRSFAKPFSVAGQPMLLTCSIGIAAYPEDGDDARTLLQKADRAMYRVKANGKNGHQLYDGDDRRPVRRNPGPGSRCGRTAAPVPGGGNTA